MIEEIGRSLGRIAETLLVVFIVLKLLGLLAWSWWWVFSPLWIPGIVVVVVFCADWLFGGSEE